MFKKVLDALFNASSDSEKKQFHNIAPTQFQRQSISPLDDIVMNAHDTAFLDHLFGESSLDSDTDPFSDYISGLLERILVSPETILNELPVMPASVTTLITELQNEEFNIDALLEVIESEPCMAADVIKLANSSRYSRSDRQVADLKKAFMNIGAQGLIEGVINAYIQNFTPSFNLYWRHLGENIWKHSLQTAEFSKQLVKDTDLEHEEAIAYFIGLIRNLGRMVIFQLMLEAFRHVDPNASHNSSEFKKLIHKYDTIVTLSIARFWKLPETVLVALAFQTSQSSKSTPLGVVVQEANYLSELKCVLFEKSIDIETLKQQSELMLSSANARQIASILFDEERKEPDKLALVSKK
ncbi:HDOD domain-containing protein [Vibrio sp. S4M6]|uniref:HDOD domain-containing protein n=1 Tax=Vibrio sinus TaxID=2946865 RepID=UPI00202AB4D4|nr:HDOD domain-containing protein [Vibrio sinus]MCL9779986.1 HDOD domain-containing protein [Vibrio sinus]